MAGPASRKTLFDPSRGEPFRLSRSKLQLFLDCPRCFYLDRRLGIGRPDGPVPGLNIAVDALLKREFDDYRASGTAHPLMTTYGVEAVPCRHPLLHVWRDNFAGIEHAHRTGFIVHGALDDLWQAPDGTFLVAEYKATGGDYAANLEGEYRESYMRQMEIYQWLVRRNGLPTGDTGYFVFAGARKDQPMLGDALKFTLSIVPYRGSDDWIDDALAAAKDALCGDRPPTPSLECPWCAYRSAARKGEAE